ncbi:MAG: argininosuccinate lyase [Lysobacteraceae bacterium]|nr:MAG: argininosuccinate lyase [Xanthomonadaceae bacterium]
MSQPIWSKGQASVDALVQGYLAGEDVILDRELLPFDIKASQAHVKGLARIGIVSDDEATAIVAALRDIGEDFSAGKLTLDAPFEDGHSALEEWLTQRLGDVGRKVHTGRSRNDQVQVAMRLLLKHRIDQAIALVHECALAALDMAKSHQSTPLPGYTHLQRAVPTTIGAWMAGFAEAWADDLALMSDVKRFVDCNPLGTAAGHGVNLPIDRQFTTSELGFDRMQVSPQYAQNSRGTFEVQVLMALLQPLQSVRRLAWDLSLFTTAEFAFVKLPDVLTTGSSIMPNKRNPDLIELLRASPAVVQGAIGELWSIMSLPSGYHRDLQATKPPTMRGLQAAIASLSQVPTLLRSLWFDHKRIDEAMEGSMLATDKATELAADGVPFRQAYQQVGNALHELDELESEQLSKRVEASIEARNSPGGAGKLMLDEIARRIG